MSSSMKSVFITANGGPEVLQVGQQPIPSIGPDSVLIRNTYGSVNFIDTYHRGGLYKVAFPFVIGRDGAGVIEKVGENVTHLKKGDRVGYFAAGAYAELVSAAVTSVFKISDDISLEDAVCLTTQGLTAHYLIRSSYEVKPNDWILIYAGAGGTGGVAIQIAKARGANVITCVSTEEKAKLARKYGADEVLVSSAPGYGGIDSVVPFVKKITNNIGVAAVYDGVGKETWEASLKSVRRRGTVVFFGNASGPVPAIDPFQLTAHGSIFITRPTLNDYIATQQELQWRVDECFQLIKEGKLTCTKHPKVFTLEEAAEAHKTIEGRGAVGKILIKI